METEQIVKKPAPSQLAVLKSETLDVVQDRIKHFQNTGEILFPANYSPENALKSAWLTLQETVDKSNCPALTVCTKESIANSLLSLVIQGLNTDKKQAYFIVYGNKLQLQRSYFGSVVVAKQVNEKIDDIIGDVIYKGDIFKVKKIRGKTVLEQHEQDLMNMDKSNIIGGYANILYKDGTDEVVVMTIAQIHQAWKQSKMGVFNEIGEVKSTSLHGKFTEEMVKKTVINRATKHIINTSDDHNIVVQTYKQTEDANIEAEARATIAEHANTQIVDIVVEYTVDRETGEVLAPEQNQIEREEEPTKPEILKDPEPLF